MLMLSIFGLLFLLMFLGVPVSVSLGASTLITAYFFTDMDLIGITSHVFDGLNKYSLMAIPMFILAGSFLSKGGAAHRIIEFAKSIVGHLSQAVFLSLLFLRV